MDWILEISKNRYRKEKGKGRKEIIHKEHNWTAVTYKVVEFNGVCHEIKQAATGPAIDCCVAAWIGSVWVKRPHPCDV